MKSKIKIIVSYILLLLSLNSCTILALSSLDALQKIYNKDEFYDKYIKSDNIDKKLKTNINGNVLDYKEVNGVKYYYSYKKKGPKSKNLLLYVHGGAFYTKVLSQVYVDMVDDLSEKTKSDFDVLYLNYKGTKFPRQTDELNILFDFIEKDYEKIIIAGDSSGGNVVLSSQLMKRDRKKRISDGIILLSPYLDLTTRVKSRFSNFDDDVLLGKSMYNEQLLRNDYVKDEKDWSNPYISPVYGEYKGFPPTLIQYGAIEILEDDSKIVCYKMNKSGTNCTIESYPRMPHVFQITYLLDQTQIARDKMVKFIDKIFLNKK